MQVKLQTGSTLVFITWVKYQHAGDVSASLKSLERLVWKKFIGERAEVINVLPMEDLGTYNVYLLSIHDVICLTQGESLILWSSVEKQETNALESTRVNISEHQDHCEG